MTDNLAQKDSADYGGLVLWISLPGESSAVRESLLEHVQFTKHVSTRDVNPNQRDICLLRCETIKDTLWLCRLSKRDATGECRLVFTECIPLDLDLDGAPSPINEQLQIAFSKGEDRLQPETWRALLAWICKEKPELKIHIDELERLRLEASQPIETARDRIIAEEWDATGTAMEFCGFNRKDNLPPLKPEILERGEPFVLNMANAKTLEEDILPYEMRNVLGWELFKECKGGVVQLRRSGRRGELDHELTIINANKKALEECLGVDLILHNSAFGSCVLIQYKRLKKSGGTWGFDLNDAQLCKQLDAIKLFKSTHFKAAVSASPHEYRTGEECFFVKFIQDETSDSLSTSLFKGWYVPVEYLETLKASPITNGPGGGKRLNEKNALRWFNNSDFSPLVASGWIGTREKHTNLIKEMINASLLGNRALVFALSKRVGD